jgi:lipopolysaccharide transport system permease protein
LIVSDASTPPERAASSALATRTAATPSLDAGSSFRALWRHRRLIHQFVRREVQSRYRGSVLGVLWSFLNPLVQLAIYTFVFGVVFRARWPQLASGRLGEFALVLFCGLIVLNLFAECLSRSPGLILSQATYVKKVVFPLEVLPAVALGSALFNAFVSVVVLAAAHLVVDHVLSWTLLLAPVVLLPLVLLTLGVSFFVSSLGVFLRDLPYLIGLLLQMLAFLTPIFYPLEALPDWARPLIVLNPLTPAVDDLRRVVLWGRLPDGPRLAFSLLEGALALVLGHAWFAKTRRAFADVV